MALAEIGDATAVACSHCGLPVPAGLIRAGEGEQFCCEGCRTVYEVIHSEGLDRYYEVKSALAAAGAPARTTGRRYEEFDDPSFHALYVRPEPGGLLRCELYLEGVHCAACVWLVERVPRLVDGAIEVRLDLGRARAQVLWDPSRSSLSAIARALDALGYPAHPFRGVKASEMARREDRSLLIKLAVAGAAAGNVMLIAFCLYGGMWTEIEPAIETFFRWVSLVLTLPSVVFSASVFYRGAWGALRARALHMDVPVSLGILAGFSWGAANTITGRGEIYFDSVTALVFLLLVGRWLLRRQQRSAADAAELVHALAPRSAHLVRDDGTTRDVPVDALVPGMRIEVRANESIPVDGIVREGRSALDASLLTGESRPVEVRAGDIVNAGTVNLEARLAIEVTAAGEETRLGRLMELVEDHARRRAPIVLLADRLSGWFVLAVLALAAATLAISWTSGAHEAIDRAVALLIVTCPCALGLATPLAVSAAIGRAARRGILIKGGDALERLARPGRIWLDKTGTITRGQASVVRTCGDASVLPLVGALERGSSHPIACALAAAFDDGAARTVLARERQGSGIEGTVDGRSLVVGSPAFVESIAGALPAALRAGLDGLLDDGLTPVAIACDGRVSALAGVGDPLRPDAAAAIARLRALGFEPAILSGDHQRVVDAVARDVGIDPRLARGAASPEEKVRVVEESTRSGVTIMVGDGVNDAAALAAATAGVAVHGGAEAALAAADVSITRAGLEPIAELAEGARHALAVIRRNLVVSLLYNLVGAALAIAGLINPLVAAVLMPASSLTVIALSGGARTFRGDSGPTTANDDSREVTA